MSRRSHRRPTRNRPLLVHVTTVDMSLTLLLLPQLLAFRDAGYEVVGVAAPGEHVATLEVHGIRHVPLTRSARAPRLTTTIDTAALLDVLLDQPTEP